MSKSLKKEELLKAILNHFMNSDEDWISTSELKELESAFYEKYVDAETSSIKRDSIGLDYNKLVDAYITRAFSLGYDVGRALTK